MGTGELDEGGATPSGVADTKKLKIVVATLIASLAFVLQLALASPSSAAAGDPCPQTGMETVATDAFDYPPGDTVHVTGTGYAPGCDVQVNIGRPDNVVDSATVTTDIFGNLAYDYLLPPPPGVIGGYSLDVLGYADTLLAHMNFTDANNDANIVPGWAPTNTPTAFYTLYRKTTGGTVQHVRITLPVDYTNVSVPATAFSSGTWGTPVVGPAVISGPNQHGPTVDVSLTSGTGLATNNVDWARIDVMATTPSGTQSGNAAEWLMQTFTNTAGTGTAQDDNPPVLIGDTTNPSAAITFVDGSGNPIVNPVFQNGVPATVRVRITSASNGSGTNIKYTDIAVPTCFSSPTGVTLSNPGGNAYTAPTVTDGFVRMGGGTIAPNNGGTLTATFTSTPNCVSGTYLVSSTPSTNASNPPSGTGQSVSTTGGSLTVAAGLADLSITKTDSPDPVAVGSTLTYTIGVHNAGPDDASAVKVVDTLPGGVTFVSATGTNWTCNNVSGTVTCNRTGGNLAAGADAPNITVAVTPTGTRRTMTNSATVSSPNDNTSGNNTATANTLADNPPTATVSLNDHSPKTNDTLTATATKADIDGDAVTLTYVWKVNGVVKKTTSGSNSLTDTFDLSLVGNGSKGDTVTVEVTPNDGALSGSTASDTSTVVNTAPTATVSLNTHSPQTNDTLTATATKADVDGDAVTLTYVWKVNGVTKQTTSGSSSLTDTFDLSQPGNGDQGDTITVEVTPNDGTATGATVSDSATLSNHAPTATVSLNDHSPKTNDTLTATATKADADGDTVTLTYVWKVNGVTKRTTSGSSSLTDTFDLSQAGNGSKGDTVTVEVTPNDSSVNGTAAIDSATVANSAPTVTLSGANDLTVSEGSTHTYNYAISDADGDTIASVATSCGASGTKSNASNTNTSGQFDCSFADGPNSSTVSAQATDSGFGAAAGNTATQNVTVNNVAPSIAISGVASVNEGSPYSLTLGAVTDPGTDTVSSYVVHWGDGLTDTYSTTGAKSHTYADGPNDYAITVDLVDEDGTFNNRANALSVHVNNVTPSITISGNASVNEGSAYSLTLSAVADPGNDTVSSYVVHWGDGSSDTYSSNGAKSHTYADGPNDYAITVDLVDEDGTFLNRANPFSVHVNNMAPSITISGAANVNEGSPYSLTLGSVSDPGADTVSSYVVHWGDGSSDSYSSNGSKSHTYADGPNDYNITVDLVDEDGTFLDRANPLSVHVNNAPPSVTAAAGQSSNEGSSHSFDIGSFSDAGADAPWTVSIDWGDGSFSTVFTMSSAGTIAAQSHTYADGPNDYTVSVNVSDKNGASDTETFSVHVNNVPPSIAISGNASVNEGSAYSLTLGAVSDPGTDTVSSYVVHWGDGQTDTYSSNGTKSHIYADGPDDHSITVDLVDEDGTFNNRANALSVHVNNVTPSIAISGNANVNEGSPYSLTLGAVTDPGTDTVSSYIVHWGDGQSDTYPSNGAKSHTYADGPNNYAITVDLVDEDGTFLDRANALSVHVDNVAPTAHLTGPANVDEGTTRTYTFTVTDPGQDTFTVNQPTYPDCGSGGSYVPSTLSTNAGGGSFDCFFPDGPATTNVAIRVTDSDGASDTDSESVQVVNVANVAPSVTAAADQASNEGASHSFDLGSFTDPGDDSPWHVSVDWGDGSFATTFDMTATGTIPAQNHTYADGPNDYTATVTVDDGTDHTSKSFSVHVNNVAPSIAISGDANVNEGSSYSLTLGAVTDPGTDTVSSYIVHWGDGSSDTYSSNGAKSHTYADGPNNYAITVDLVDEDGTYLDRANALSVHVNNVAPTVTLSAGNDLSVNEGSSHTYSYTISDPGQDTVQSVTTSCGGNGTKVPFSDANTNTSGSFGCTFPDGDAGSTVSVQATDSDNDAGNTNTQSVTIHNVAPSIAISGDANVDEGSAYSLSLGAVTDPGTDTVSSYIVHWGDGSTNTYSSNGAKSHTYADGPSNYAITVDLVDEDGTFLDRANPLSVHVNNVAPSITISGNASVDEGSPYTLTLGAISDPGQDTVSSYVVHWGDGSTTYGSNGAKSHTYADGPNTYAITVDLVDEDGTFLNRANPLSAHVDNVVPSIAISGNTSVDEGSAYGLNLGPVTDPGADTVSSYVVHWGDGSTNTYSSNGVKSHTYADGPNNYAITVDLVDEDGTFLDRANPLSVHVNNVAPTAHLTGDATADEGTTHHYTYTVSDPGQDTFSVNSGYPTCGSGGQLVLASVMQTPTGGSLDCFFPNGPTTTSVAIKVTDEDGASTMDSESVQVVDVANVPPSVTAPANQSSNEGENHSFSLGSFTDPGADNPWHVTVAWGDGSATTTFDATSTGTLPATPHAYADGPNDYTVTVSVNDGAATDSKTFSVHVNNVAPTVTLTGPLSANEGTAYTYSYTVSDPGSETFSRDAQSCDGGTLSNASFNSATGAGSFDCKWDDGPSSHSPSVTVSDGDGGSDSKSLAVTVNNVAPMATFGNNGPVNEGQSFTLTLTSPQDPSSADTAAGFTYAFDCGSGYVAFGSSNTTTCPTNDNGTRTVNGKIKDKDGGEREYTATVTVNNVAPTATFGNNGPVNEGQSFTLTLTSAQDPSSADTTAGFQYAFDCGSGSGYGAYGPSNTATCPTNDNSVRTVNGKIKDRDGGVAEYTGSVTVNNVRPIVIVTSPAYGTLYAKNGTSNPTVTTTANLTDAGTADTHTCSVAWDDGTTSPGTMNESNGSGTCTASHTFTTAGVFTYHVTVTDDDGGSTTADWMIVVYDASAGFVTGGGWINVAAGSYPADPTLSGRANFGFNSQYKKGATVPTGETEFNFQVGNFNFHSDAYSWLVVQGFKAQYKGSGSVNGVSGYDFTLTAYDGDVSGGGGTDKFRIRITLHNNGNVVFDNRITNGNLDMDTADPQAIAGGSIVIHKA